MVSIVNIAEIEEGLMIDFSDGNSFLLKDRIKIRKANKKLAIGQEYKSFLTILDII